MFFKVSNEQQNCISLIKNTVKSNIVKIYFSVLTLSHSNMQYNIWHIVINVENICA